MADTLDRFKTAFADRYAFEGQSGVARLTTAKAAARQSVGKPTLILEGTPCGSPGIIELLPITSI